MNTNALVVVLVAAIGGAWSLLAPDNALASLLLLVATGLAVTLRGVPRAVQSLTFVALTFLFTLVLRREPALNLVFFNPAFYGLLAVLLSSLLQPIPRWIKLLLSVSILFVSVPLVGFSNPFLFELGIQVGIFAALALGLNVVVGLAGLLDLGFAAFFAIGAYTWGIFGSGDPDGKYQSQASKFIHWFPASGLDGNLLYLFIGIAIITAAITGVLIGLPALRLRGDYLAIVTLGLGEVVRVLANNLDHPLNITNGPQGITPVHRPSVDWLNSFTNFLGVEKVYGRPLDAAMTYNLFFYLLVLVVIGIVIIVNVRLSNSRFGRAWVAIREDEVAAKTMGIPLLWTKLLAFATGAAFSGTMGAVYAAKQTFVNPESFTLVQSIFFLAMVILGGMGSIGGAVVGAAAVTLLNLDILKNLSDYLNDMRQAGVTFLGYNFANLPSQLEPAKYERLVFGLILILMMIFRPEGLIPEKRHRLELEKE